MIKIIRNDTDSFWFMNQEGMPCLKLAGTNQAYQLDGNIVTSNIAEYGDVTITVEYKFPKHNGVTFGEIKKGHSFLWKNAPYIKTNQLQCINLFTGELGCCKMDCFVYAVNTGFSYISNKIVEYRQGEWYLTAAGPIVLVVNNVSLLDTETNNIVGKVNVIKRLKPTIKVILNDGDRVSYKNLGTGDSFLHNDDVYVKGLLDSVNIGSGSSGDIYRYDEMKVRLVDLEVVV